MEKLLKIALTDEKGEVFRHFGRTERLKVYKVEGGTMLSAQVLATNGTGQGIKGISHIEPVEVP